MKIKFDPNQDFQLEAIRSVANIFEGQETCQTNFTVATVQEDRPLFEGDYQSDLGVGNRLKLLPEDILANVNKIQLHNGLAQSESLDSMDFTVEMETGTGKTYVYLRSIFEMHQKYGFTKFIIVVPSIAIKEGVYKSLQITEQHFAGLYDNVQCDYFVYDSQKLGQVRNFATSDYIQIMVINIDAFRKSFTDPEKEDKANIIHRPHDRMTGSKPIEFIQATNPIVIIDEPQSVDTTKKSKEAIASLNPLCTLRYSATHREDAKYNRMYRLDPVDAYDRKLVKQIEVAGIEVADSHNKAYIKLIKVSNKNNRFTAQVEMDIVNKSTGAVDRKKKTIKPGTDLLEASNGRDVYDGYIVNDIHCEEGNEYIDFTSKPDIIKTGQVIGEVDDSQYKRLQIKKTIEEHLEKELQLRPQGIKVLSLFFIDRVANYRAYDEDGNQVKGKYAQMFEEEYAAAIKKPKFKILFEGADLDSLPAEVHNGYFAIDKKKDASGEGKFKESKGDGTTQADEGAYQLIMKDKERLLSLDTKLKFIFSHSALREGWDNPNVFQICTLNETTSTMKKRQEIGRGLRICVNQEGERVHGFETNRLTIMANESYADYANQLQKEFEKDTGIRFGIVEEHLFANIPVLDANGETTMFGLEASKKVYAHLKQKGYIDSKGKVQDDLRTALKDETVDLPEDVADQAAQIAATLRKVAGGLNIRNKDDRARVNLNKEVFLSPEFKDLWDRVKYKSTFRVDFDCEALVAKCAEEIKKKMVVGKARFHYRKADIVIDRGGVEADEDNVRESTSTYEAKDFPLPDIVSYLQNATNLTRRSIVKILIDSDRLDDFKKNPQKFIEQATRLIRDQMSLFIVNGIKYQKIGDQDYYAQELFESHELYGYLKKNMLESQKSVYQHVVYDSDVERNLAVDFESHDEVKLFAKLPTEFKIQTPLGPYSPDWVVLIEADGEDKLYFVVESKGGMFANTLRPTEQGKIDCAKEHFKAVGDGVKCFAADNYNEVTKHF
jgi:type III restriction enzyme